MRRFVGGTDRQLNRRGILIGCQGVLNHKAQIRSDGMKRAVDVTTEAGRTAPGFTGAIVLGAVHNTRSRVARSRPETVRRNERRLKQDRNHRNCHEHDNRMLPHRS